MSGLFSSLNASVMALTAQSRALEITGKNLSNVNNPAYARQRVLFGDRGTVQTPLGAESLGLEALGVQQVRDALLDTHVMQEVSLSSFDQAEQQGYQQAQTSLGQSIASSNSTSGASSTSDNGIGASLDDLFNSFQSFAANPTDSGQRLTLIQNATILTERLHLADTHLAQVQSDLGSQVTSDVKGVNDLLTQIASLNDQIDGFEVNAPGSAVDLRDARQGAFEKLAAKMPIDVHVDNKGYVQVTAKSSGGVDVVLVDRKNVKGTVAFTGTQITAGSPATVLGLASGSIQGSLTARDGAVQTLRDNLDQLANQLVTSVNGAYNPTGLTGDFFNASGTTASTIALDPTVTAANLKASDGGPAGDNTIALAVAQLASQKFSTTAATPDLIDGTFSGFYSTTVANLGAALSGANARVEDQNNTEQFVRGQRDSVSGVSLDEETSNLVKYQRAFQASSRMFSVINDLLDTVVHLGL